MDWEALLADVESRFEAERRAELVAHSVELAEAESASVAVGDRLRAAVGSRLHLRTRAGVPVEGVLLRAEPAYALLDEGDGLRAIVPVGAIATLAALPGPAPADRGHRPGMGALLRELARRGVRVRLILAAGEVVGRIVRVGSDHLDVVVGDQEDAQGLYGGRARNSRGRGAMAATVMLEAIEAIRSR